MFKLLIEKIGTKLHHSTTAAVVLFVVLLAASFAVFWPTLGVGFLSDDWGYAYGATHATLGERLGTLYQIDPYMSGPASFRPLASLFVALVWKLLVTAPWALHALAITLQALTAWMVGLLCYELFRRRGASVVASIGYLFVPLAVEQTVWLTASLLLPGLCLVLAVLRLYAKKGDDQFNRTSLAGLVAIAFAAMAFWEPAILLPVYLCGIDALRQRKINWRPVGTLAATAFVFLGWRLAVLGIPAGFTIQGVAPSHFLNASVVFEFAKLPLFYISGLFNALAVPVVLGWTLRATVTLLAAAVIVAIVRERGMPLRQPALRMLLLLLALMFASHVFGSQTVHVADPIVTHSRMLAMSTVWVCVLLAWIWTECAAPFVRGVLVVLLCLLPVATIFQLQPWLRAGRVTTQINQVVSLTVPQQPSQYLSLSVAKLPESYQGAFIYRNGFEFAVALLADIRREDITATKDMQFGLGQTITINQATFQAVR